MGRKLLVTHHAPDLDAITAVWLFQRFDAEHFADAHVAFVNPGSVISEIDRQALSVSSEDVVHVDTGMGEFDHHQAERGHERICASSLVLNHLHEVYPDLKNDSALKELVAFVTEIDHFGEIDWPDAGSFRYDFMIQELIRGLEFSELHTDESQLHFGFTCLDSAYSILTQHVKAGEIIAEKGRPFDITAGRALALETRNDDTIKLAQKQGYVLVVKKNPELGHIRIKARPDNDIDLKPVAEAINEIDHTGTWYYHPSGKMLINGSRKHQEQTASPLSLEQVVKIIKDKLG